MNRPPAPTLSATNHFKLFSSYYFGSYLQGLNVSPTGSNRCLLPTNALFSLTFRPPDSVVFLAPDFHGSGVMIFVNFFSHFSQTISIVCCSIKKIKEYWIRFYQTIVIVCDMGWKTNEMEINKYWRLWTVIDAMNAFNVCQARLIKIDKFKVENKILLVSP